MLIISDVNHSIYNELCCRWVMYFLENVTMGFLNSVWMDYKHMPGIWSIIHAVK